jgi:hypothetical protein
VATVCTDKDYPWSNVAEDLLVGALLLKKESTTMVWRLEHVSVKPTRMSRQEVGPIFLVSGEKDSVRTVVSRNLKPAHDAGIIQYRVTEELRGSARLC